MATYRVLLAMGLLLIGNCTSILAQNQPTEAQILDALRPREKTRSFTFTNPQNDPKVIEERSFIDSLRTRSARSLTIEEREKAAAIAKERPSIDLEINFDFNSATVGTKAVPVLLTLGRAMSNDELKGTIFFLNGHTDAKGSFEYNQALSERRAEAVKRILFEQFNLPTANLIAVGYGKTQLKNKLQPFAGENRRVQIVNTEQTASESRQ